MNELHRILKSGGTLLVSVPSVSMDDPDAGELWRFVPNGLRMVLSTVFDRDKVLVRGYGNSLVAAAEWFPVEVCARAVK